MQTRAIILKKQNTNEYDQLVTCYTEEFGKLTAIAKSVLKPSSIQAMHLDVFNLVEFDLISGRGMPIITGAQVEETYLEIKSNLSRLAAAYFFTEVIDRIAFDYQQDGELWNFLSSLIGKLNKGADQEKDFVIKNKIAFLNILGYAPNFGECIFCSKAELVAYNPQARGGVCKDCFLGGQQGIVVKDGDFLSEPILNSIFEALIEQKLYSLNLINAVNPHTK